MKKYILALLLLGSMVLKAQTTDKPSMVEYLSNVVLFNPTFIHIHETEGKMTHDIMVSGRWKYEIEFKNRKQEAVFSVFDDQNNLLFEVKEDAEKPATIIDLSSYGPGIYTIQRKAKNKVFVFEVERLM
jgi:predicted sugar kinase